MPGESSWLSGRRRADVRWRKCASLTATTHASHLVHIMPQAEALPRQVLGVLSHCLCAREEVCSLPSTQKIEQGQGVGQKENRYSPVTGSLCQPHNASPPLLRQMGMESQPSLSLPAALLLLWRNCTVCPWVCPCWIPHKEGIWELVVSPAAPTHTHRITLSPCW